MSVFDAKSVGRKSGVASVLSASNVMNVKVLLRVRPLSDKDRSASEELCLTQHDDAVSIAPPGSDLDKAKSFQFDKVLWTDSTQEDTYRFALHSMLRHACVCPLSFILLLAACCVRSCIGSPLIERLFNGFNVTIVSYGPTGTGKSFSILGEGAHVGIVPRLIDDVFR